MPIVNISGTINLSFTTSGTLVNASQVGDEAIFTIDLRSTTPKIIVQDGIDYPGLGWNINNAVAVITLVGPQGVIYKNEDYDNPDIVPGTSRYLNKTITMPLDPITNYENILQGNYTLAISWYNSILDEYYSFLKTYHYDLTLPTIENTTVSGPYTGILKSTDDTDYGSDVHQIIREHRVIYPDELDPQPSDVVSSNAEIQVTPIYTNEWTIQINSFVEYRFTDTLRVFWEGSGEFTHCVYGGCIGAMYDALETMLATYTDELACNVITKEQYQQRLTIVNTAWHLLNEAYWSGDTEEADQQSYIIQEQVAYTGSGTCGDATSEEVIPCPEWTGGGTGGTFTFENGLTEAATVVGLGGVLTEPTTFTMVGHQVQFTGTSAGDIIDLKFSAANGFDVSVSDGGTEGQVKVQSDTVEFKYTDLGTPANSRTYTLDSLGLREDIDYSGSYVLKSLVNKNYVDTLFAAASTYTFEYGVVDTGGGVVHVDISNITERALAIDEGDLLITYDNDYVGEKTYAITWGTVRDFIVSEFNFTLGVNSIIYSGSDGIIYGGDYEANFVDRSLVTKQWVEDNFVQGTLVTAFTGLTDTPVSYTGFGGYFVRVNTGETALEFVSGSWVPVGGGTFTGPVTIATSNDKPLIIQQIGAGSTPGIPEAGINLISFQDGDGDEQGYVGIDASGRVALRSYITGGGIYAFGDLLVDQDLTVLHNVYFEALPNDEAETHLVGYETSTGLLSYQTVSTINNYTNANVMPEDVGGYEAGTTFSAVAFKDLIDGLLYPYQYPAFTSFEMSGQATTLECGVEIAIGIKTWDWLISNDSNILPNTIDIDDITDTEVIVSNTDNTPPEDAEIDSAVTKTTTGDTHIWRISAQNSKSQTFQRDFTVVWYSPFYYGEGAQSLTVAQIQALTKEIVGFGNKTYGFAPSGEVMYFAYPASYGDLTSILDENSFETINDWTKRTEDFTNNPPNYEGTTVSYNIYEFDNVTSLAQDYQFIF